MSQFNMLYYNSIIHLVHNCKFMYMYNRETTATKLIVSVLQQYHH